MSYEKAVFNPLKLSEHLQLFIKQKVLVIGAGAVGSYTCEFLAKLGCGEIHVIDFDTLSAENVVKASSLCRMPEDIGRNKAVCVAERLPVLMQEGGIANGINGEISLLGPEALAQYVTVFLCVDNYDAKLLLAELLKQIPGQRRPIAIMAGTNKELASSVIVDSKELCLRCLISEDWLPDSQIRTSCGAPQYRKIDGEAVIIRTSNMASSTAAHLAVEQFRAYVIGKHLGQGLEKILNKKLTYTAYPVLDLEVSTPISKEQCPACSVRAPDRILTIPGSVMRTTLGEALTKIAEMLQEEDIELIAPRLHYHKTLFSRFIADAECPCCGAKVPIYRHESRMLLEDFFCRDCQANGRVSEKLRVGNGATMIDAFTTECSQRILDMTLYDLGYPLGGYLEVVVRNQALDYLDFGIEKHVVTFSGDPGMMESITSLERSTRT